jgi:hypothetical protein
MIWYTMGIMGTHELSIVDEERLETAEELLRLDIFPGHGFVNMAITVGFMGLSGAALASRAVVSLSEKAVAAVRSRRSDQG